MTRQTKIEWAEASWNPVVGCSHTSSGCDRCYAERIAARYAGNADYPGYYNEVISDGKWNGRIARKEQKFNPKAMKRSRTILIGSMCDLFHPSVYSSWIANIIDVVKETPRHRYMILTKRPARMKEFMQSHYPEPIPNLALGVSVENQITANHRIPALLETPAAKRFVSAEPLLGSLHLHGEWLSVCRQCGATLPRCREAKIACCPDCEHGHKPFGLDLVIIGGETGSGARPAHPLWIREITDECEEHGVPVFFKHWGEWSPDQALLEKKENKHNAIDLCYWPVPRENAHPNYYRKMYLVGRKRAGREIDGRTYDGTINWS
jgi:protein gp37